MRLSKASYYADFVVYPVAVLALAGTGLHGQATESRVGWLVAFLVGLTAWTLIEYVLHRFVFHHFPVFADQHNLHHQDSIAYFGTPTWLSLMAFGALGFVPLWWGAGLVIASGAMAGLMLGYLCYVSVHHAVHHWRLGPDSLLYRAKLRHAHHHYACDEQNFGVTTGFWDAVFRTAFDRRSSRRKAA
jgi:sterol desaturase/sphingolipid hydroxylase (fatty acid hydroxylase superfamily)